MLQGQSLQYYLDLEQHLATNQTCSARTCQLITWVAPPTVICGKHQDIESEVNLSYCREHGIAVVQRNSGGGCVYADSGNLMLSWIGCDITFADCMNRLAHVLSELICHESSSARVVTTEHNDILVDGRKVCGGASYKFTPFEGALEMTIVHTTLLYDVNMESLEMAIHPSQQKLKKHAVASVRQRVRNIKDILPPSIQSIADLADELERRL